MIYFDNASTTRVCDEAMLAFKNAAQNAYANPSSVHKMGVEAQVILTDARQKIAEKLNANPNEIFFTSGGTEANNLAIFGGCFLKKGSNGHIITSKIEHPSVLEPIKELKEKGFEVSYIKVKRNGEIDINELKAQIKENTILVSLMAVNNETGAILNIKEAIKAVKQQNKATLFHTDAVQAFCKIPLDVKALEADLLSISGHKIHAPKGVGALYIKNGVKIKPVIFGGGQENKIRSGTESVANISAFAEASCVYDNSRVELLRKHLENQISSLNNIEIICENGIANILCLSLKGTRGEVTQRVLSDKGIYVSTSSACNRGKASATLTALNLPKEITDGAIRISLSRYNTNEEIDTLVSALLEVQKMFGRK